MGLFDFLNSFEPKKKGTISDQALPRPVHPLYRFQVQTLDDDIPATAEVKRIMAEEIHEDFYRTALEAFSATSTLEYIDPGLLDKVNRMAKLGFTKANGIKEVSEAEKLNNYKRNVVDAMNYFKLQYPNHKAILGSDAKNVADKYGLLIKSPDSYIGDIPLKNIKEIESFKVKEKDVAYFTRLSQGGVSRVSHKSEMMIAAPQSDFKISPYLSGFAISFDFYTGHYFNHKYRKVVDKNGNIRYVVNDPIVLQPVHYFPKGMTRDPLDYENYNPIKAYIIVSAWGPEASDELIVNHNNN